MTQLSLLDRDWCDNAMSVVSRFDPAVSFTTDDLHGVLPEPEHRNWYGVLLARMRKTGLVEKLGYIPSTRPEANGRVVALWRLK